MAGRARTAIPPSSTMAEKVAETLENLALQPEDAAVAALALKYAETLDRTAAIAAAAAKLPFDPDTAEAVEALKKRVAAVVAVSDLGPKLLASLDALGATPKARVTAGKPPLAGGKSKLSALREAVA